MADDIEEVVSTDQGILNDIGEGDAPTDNQDGEVSTATETTTPSEISTTSSQQDTGKGGNDQQQKTTGGPQDLVGRDGKVIAVAGRERRFYEKAIQEGNRASNLANEVAVLRSQLEAVNNAGTLSTQYNLTPEEVTTGAQLISAYKESPVETIQYMLTQAQASGHNVDAILHGAGGTNMDAIQQMLDTALKPLVAEHTERADTQAANDRALGIYNEFSTKYPDAAVHETSLARLLKDDPNLSPEAAYLKLQNWYLHNNLNWTKSIETLKREANAAEANGSRASTQQQLPEGGTSPANVTNKAQVADVNTSTGDIIKDAMREAGIQI